MVTEVQRETEVTEVPVVYQELVVTVETLVTQASQATLDLLASVETRDKLDRRV